MLQTYKARLHGSHIEWLGEIPVHLQDGQDVHITVLDHNPADAPLSQGQQMATVLEQLAGQNISSIPAPDTWQQEIRADKPLPGREA